MVLLVNSVALPKIAASQLCDGSLGDPFINVTFGTVNNPLPPTATTFEYTRRCPSGGQYTIQNLIFGCGNNTWYMLAGDHTRDQNGQYMLVNAESTPGIVYIDTASGLCGNTRYQFAAWIANVMQDFACGGNPVLPNLTFKVTSMTGQVLDSVTTGEIPVEDQRTWIQFGLTFTTPPDIDEVIISLSTNPPAGCGSGFVVDDITFNMCGPKLTTMLDGKVQDGNVCADYRNPFILNGIFDAGLADPVFQWQQSLDSGITFTDIPGETSLEYKIPRRTTGVIIYRLTMAERQNINSSNCRIVSNNIYTEIHPVPPHNPPQTLLGCKDKNLVLPKTDLSALSIEWAGPNGYMSTDPAAVVDAISYADTGIYRLKQNFYFGCSTTDTFFLNVYPSTTIVAQNSYSVCEGSKVFLSASGSGKFKWSPADGLSNDAIPNPVVIAADSKIYQVKVTNSYGCADSAEVTLNVLKKPVVDAGPDQSILKGDSIIIKGSARGTDISYSWSPVNYMDNPDLLTPTVFPPEDMQYVLSAVSNVGCGSISSIVNIKVFPGITAPNAFTPNGDGINDIFRLLAPSNYKIATFIIYNRWGEKLFHANNSVTGWDGNFRSLPQPGDTYVYYYKLISPEGKEVTGKGFFVLIR